MSHFPHLQQTDVSHIILVSIGNEAAHLQMGTTSQADPLEERKLAALPHQKGRTSIRVTGLIIVVADDGSHENKVRFESNRCLPVAGIYLDTKNL